MRIENLRPNLDPNRLEKQKLDSKKTEPKKQPADRAEISKEAQNLLANGSREVVQAEAKIETPVQTSQRLSAIREKIESGHYNRAEVREQIADAIIKSPALGEISGSTKLEREAEYIREEVVEEARENVRQGVYEQPEIIRETANRILDSLL